MHSPSGARWLQPRQLLDWLLFSTMGITAAHYGHKTLYDCHPGYVSVIQDFCAAGKRAGARRKPQKFFMNTAPTVHSKKRDTYTRCKKKVRRKLEALNRALRLPETTSADVILMFAIQHLSYLKPVLTTYACYGLHMSV